MGQCSIKLWLKTDKNQQSVAAITDISVLPMYTVEHGKVRIKKAF
jgi:hypothetical protein